MSHSQRLLVVTTDTPFILSDSALYAEELRDQLILRGHNAEVVKLPFRSYPPEKLLDHVLAIRALDIKSANGIPIDRVIAMKFPAYLIRHPNKVLWLWDQYRPAYDQGETHSYEDLTGHPNGVEIKEAIWRADCELIPEAKALYTMSRTASQRLKTFCNLDAAPIYSPPRHADLFYGAPGENYFFFPGCLHPLKRPLLVLQALALTRERVCIKCVGDAHTETDALALRSVAKRLGVDERIEWLGDIAEEQLRALYARALAVIFPPIEEDVPYIAFEAMLSRKAVVTCRDSGSPLEFIKDHQTGLITEPCPEDLARSMDMLWGDRSLAQVLGEAGREQYDSLNMDWDHTIKTLLHED